MTDQEHTQSNNFDSREFDEWAPDFDDEVSLASGFPFEGYEQVQETIIRQAEISPGMQVLDVGTGTGNLAMRFEALGCRVWGSDFSYEMLKLARFKAPGITFVQMDMRESWTAFRNLRFDRIVSAYAFHHFPLAEKVELLKTCASHLTPGGWIVIGDLSFETSGQLEKARETYRESWDEEPYWIAEQTLPALAHTGWRCSYQQVSCCAGVYCIQPPA